MEISRINDTQSIWQLQTAKAQFSKVVTRALDTGPQLVTKSGRPAVYVVSAEMFEAETARDGSDRKSILMASPHRDTELDLSRDRGEGRGVEL